MPTPILPGWTRPVSTSSRRCSPRPIRMFMRGCAAPWPFPPSMTIRCSGGCKASAAGATPTGRPEVDRLDYIARQPGRLTVTGAPQGYDAYLAAEAACRRARAGDKGPVLFVALDDAQADAACRAIAFFAPSMTVLPFPAWDCLPYDRVSPKPDIESRRLATLAALARDPQTQAVVVTTVNALLQRVPPKSAI